MRLPTPVGRADTAYFTGAPAVTAQVVNDAGACFTVDFAAATQSTLHRFVAKTP